VTQKVLTSQLRDLEADGLAQRKVYAEVPPRVEYSLTPLGQTLVPVLDQLETWAQEHADELLAYRARMEKKKKNAEAKKVVSV
jgi:Predicted transcriptional regulators